MAHTLLFMLGYNAPEDRLLPEDFDWNDTAAFDAALRTSSPTRCGRGRSTSTSPRTTATVFGSGSHDKTGRHCLPNAPDGKLDIVKYAGYWLRDDTASVDARRFDHICWDGCMFPNETLMKPQTWNDILATMVAVRDAHGWN